MPITRLDPRPTLAARPLRIAHLAMALALAGALVPAARADAGDRGPDLSPHPATLADINKDPMMAQFMKLSPDVRHDCIIGGFGAISLPPAYVKDATPEVLGKAADSLTHTSTLMHLPRLKQDYATMAAQVRMHGGEALSHDARMNAAMADLHAWQVATCPRRPDVRGGAPASH